MANLSRTSSTLNIEPAPLGKGNDEEQWIERTGAACFDAAVDHQGTLDQKDVAYAVGFLELLNELNPSEHQGKRLIYGVADLHRKEVARELISQGMPKKLAPQRAAVIREKFLDRCFVRPPTSTQPAQDVIEQSPTRQALETSGSASAQTQQQAGWQPRQQSSTKNHLGLTPKKLATKIRRPPELP